MPSITQKRRSFDIPAAQYEELERVARALGVPVSRLTEKLINDYLDRAGAK